MWDSHRRVAKVVSFLSCGAVEAHRGGLRGVTTSSVGQQLQQAQAVLGVPPRSQDGLEGLERQRVGRGEGIGPGYPQLAGGGRTEHEVPEAPCHGQKF